ncbi:CvpA family protein, partial [Dehalococcoidia bacterium]|nr:CvpA family protein [Dehalococcoidia bacterium]
MKELDITTLASTGTSAITWQMAANMIEYAHKISVHRRARKERREGKLVLVSFKFRFISAVSVLSVVSGYLARATVGQPASVWVQVSSKEVNMNWLDIVIIVVLGILTVLGMKRGLIKSLVPLVGVVLGIVLAGRLHHSLAERLGFIESESLAGIIAFVLILIAVYVVVSILGSMLRGMLRMVFLGWVDRLGGGVFGFAVGWIICSVIVVLLARYVALPAE